MSPLAVETLGASGWKIGSHDQPEQRIFVVLVTFTTIYLTTSYNKETLLFRLISRPLTVAARVVEGAGFCAPPKALGATLCCFPGYWTTLGFFAADSVRPLRLWRNFVLLPRRMDYSGLPDTDS
jgi:hypothetical protein